jgi:hypothetical protein
MKLRHVSNSDLQDLRIARAMIDQGAVGLRSVGALKACAYVRRALKSVDGAIRHAERANSQKA